MALRIILDIKDVTLIADENLSPNKVPQREFSIESDTEKGCVLTFDGRQAVVPLKDVHDLMDKIIEYSSYEWQHSRNPEIQATFRPLNRVVNAVNSTPSYQLFLAGFHIADSIGLFDLDMVDQDAVIDSYKYLVGSLTWSSGKKGRLFFLPDNYVGDENVLTDLLANGKLIKVQLMSITDDEVGHSLKLAKYCVPYATPIGFNTSISTNTESEWARISRLVSKQSL